MIDVAKCERGKGGECKRTALADISAEVKFGPFKSSTKYYCSLECLAADVGLSKREMEAMRESQRQLRERESESGDTDEEVPRLN